MELGRHGADAITKTFKSASELADYIEYIAGSRARATRHVLLMEMAHDALATARNIIGGQGSDALPPSGAWPDLAQSTKDERAAKGYNTHEILLREGEMRDSIETKITDQGFVIGSDNKIALWQEMGTHQRGAQHIPPRSFLGRALAVQRRNFQKKEARVFKRLIEEGK